MERKIVKNERELNNYSVYKDLCDYDKYCLLGNNYWNIMNGDYDRFVAVPPQDLHFWYYFNETCFVECDAFQRRKKMEADERHKNEVLKIDDEFKEPEPKKELKIEPEPIIEKQNNEPELIKEPEIKTKEDEMPIEENNDFLNQKQEHPKYDKKEINERIEKIKSENADKKEQGKKGKAPKKQKGEDQTSLF